MRSNVVLPEQRDFGSDLGRRLRPREQPQARRTVLAGVHGAAIPGAGVTKTLTAAWLPGTIVPLTSREVLA